MSLARALYNLLLWLLLQLIPLRLLWRGRRKPEYRAHWGERFAGNAPLSSGPTIWIHAVSVGETRAAQPLVRRLLAAYPRHRILLSHMTPTGRATARELFAADADRIDSVYLAALRLSVRDPPLPRPRGAGLRPRHGNRGVAQPGCRLRRTAAAAAAGERTAVGPFGAGLGNVAYDTEKGNFLGQNAAPPQERSYSEETAREIDCAVREIVARAFERSVAILTERKTILEDTARDMLARETLDEADLKAIHERATAA